MALTNRVATIYPTVYLRSAIVMSLNKAQGHHVLLSLSEAVKDAFNCRPVLSSSAHFASQQGRTIAPLFKDTNCG